jgi:hypothetical protein
LTVTGATTLNQRYDVFGRATTTDVGTQVVEQNAYDGYDRLTRQQKFDAAGNPTYTRVQAYDPFDRVSSQAEKVGTAKSITTRYTFVGLADQVTAEEQLDTAGAWKTSKSYSYGAHGENLSLVDSPVNGTTSEKSFYGTNPHGDVETLTDPTGSTTSTYRYTAYGQPDKIGTTGDDAITGNPTRTPTSSTPTGSTANGSTAPPAPTTWASASTIRASTATSAATTTTEHSRILHLAWTRGTPTAMPSPAGTRSRGWSWTGT